jgi:hypothetical protein
MRACSTGFVLMLATIDAADTVYGTGCGSDGDKRRE